MENLDGGHVFLSFLFVFYLVSTNEFLSDFFKMPFKRALQTVVHQARVSLISVQWKSYFTDGRKCISTLFSLFIDRFGWNLRQNIII